MDEKKAKSLADFIFKDIFGRDNPFSLDELEERFAYEINLPRKVKDDITGADLWSSFPKKKMVSTRTIMEQGKMNLWAKKPKPIRSMDDVAAYWEDINYFQGDKNMASQEVLESDGVYMGHTVYRSTQVFNSQNILFSEDAYNCKYLMCSLHNSACTSGIRMVQNTFCTSSFAVTWSKKVSKSMFVNGSYNLYECLFCSNIDSKQYCVCNMQLPKEEYLKVKRMVVDWAIKNFDGRNNFGL